MTKKEHADPEALTDFRTHFTTWFIWFVKDYVLAHWDMRIVNHAGDQSVCGSDCDDLLIEICRRSRVPLISNEGYGVNGVRNDDPKGLRAKAIAAGVAVFTPRQFWNGKVGEAGAARWLLRAFDKQLPRYLHGRRRGSPMAENLADMRGYFEHVLFGRTRMPDERLPTRLPDAAPR